MIVTGYLAEQDHVLVHRLADSERVRQVFVRMLTVGNLGGTDRPRLRSGRFVNYPYYTHADSAFRPWLLVPYR